MQMLHSSSRNHVGVVVAACWLAAGTLRQPSSDWPPALTYFPAAELYDIECEKVTSALVDWPALRSQLRNADDEWVRADMLPVRSCDSLNLDHADSDALIVLARPDDAAAECALGAISAILILLLCTMECVVLDSAGPVGVFNRLWRGLLGGPDSLPVYMLGTTSWPAASLVAKWQAHCSFETPPAQQQLLHEHPCNTADVRGFTASIRGIADEFLFPTLWRPGEIQGIEGSLGRFVHRILPALTQFMNSITATAVDLVAKCPETAAAQGTFLLLVRLFGPPVARDPLDGARLSELGSLLARLPLGVLIGGHRWASIAVLAALRHLTKRSHNLFGEVTLSDIRRLLEIGHEELQERSQQQATALQKLGGDGLLRSLQQIHFARRRLWLRIASYAHQGTLWGQLARWFLASDERHWPQKSAETDNGASVTIKSAPPGIVYLTMGFGQIDGVWLRGFLQRAIDVQLPRLIFITPDRIWFLVCEEVRQEQKVENFMLCVRSFARASRPYDNNNKAKFYMIPVILALGMDVVWIDLDVFLFKDPTQRLLQQISSEPEQPKDILVTDHFDKHCLNHGVFMVRATDRSLLWMIQFIKWLHWYPFGHDRSGWDAFLNHSSKEPQLPEDLASDPATNVTSGVLSTQFEFLTLSGWAGGYDDIHRVQLLHFTSMRGLSDAERMSRLVRLFNATARRPHETKPNQLRVQAAMWKVLRPLQASMPIWKRPCQESPNFAIDQLIEVGLYEELLH